MKKLGVIMVFMFILSSFAMNLVNAIAYSNEDSYNFYISLGLGDSVSTTTPYSFYFEEWDVDDGNKIWSEISEDGYTFYINDGTSEDNAQSEKFTKRIDWENETYFLAIADGDFPNDELHYWWIFAYWNSTEKIYFDANSDAYLRSSLSWWFDVSTPSTNIITLTVTVTDVNGNPIPNAEIYFTPIVQSDTGIWEDREAEMMENALVDMNSYLFANYNTSKGAYWITDNNGQVEIKIPHYVLDGNNDLLLNYTFNLTAHYENYVSNAVTINTENGDQNINLQFNEQIISTEKQLTISFFSDEAMSEPFSLYGYNISVQAYINPTDSPTSITNFQIINNKLIAYIPDQYNYVDVALTYPDTDNTVFYKMYHMDGDLTINEVISEPTYPVIVYIYSNVNGDPIANLTTIMTSKTQGKQYMSDPSDENGKMTLYVPADDYILKIIKMDGTILKYEEITISKATTITYYVIDQYAKVIKLKLYSQDKTLIDPNYIACSPEDFPKYCRYWARFYSPKDKNGYYDYLVYLRPDLQNFVLDAENGEITIYINDNTELSIWENGVYFQILDQNNQIIKQYNLIAPDVFNTFTLFLPFSWDVKGNEVEMPYLGEYDVEKPTTVTKYSNNLLIEYLFGKGFFFIITAIILGFEASKSNAVASLGIALMFILLFGAVGAIPKSLVYIASIGLGVTIAGVVGKGIRGGKN